jgi:undecaprenyl-diphosphatase
MQFLIGLDQKLFLFLNQFHHELINGAMIVLSSTTIWIPFILFMIFSLYKALPRQQFYLALLFLFLAFIASDTSASYVLKNLTQRLRPCRDEMIKPLIYWFNQKCGGRFGFVSSHSANAFALVMFWWKALPQKKINYKWLWIFPAVVAYSRLYLGVHYPADLVVGAIIGLTWGYILSWCLKHNRLRS